MIHAIILALALSSIGVDAAYTNANAHNANAHEANPIARPFFHAGTAPLAGYFAGTAGAVYYADRRMSRKHKRLAIALDLAVIGAETYWTAYSATHYRRDTR